MRGVCSPWLHLPTVCVDVCLYLVAEPFDPLCVCDYVCVFLCLVAEPFDQLAVLTSFSTALWSELAAVEAAPLSYVNYLDPTLGSLPSQLAYLQWYYGNNTARLREVKARVDPNMVFTRPQGIPPGVVP